MQTVDKNGFFPGPAAGTDQECRNPVSLSWILGMFDASSDLVLIINRNRETVFVNSQLVQYTGSLTPDSLLGKRPGAIFGCMNSGLGNGCGTTEFCVNCSANLTIDAMFSSSYSSGAVAELPEIEKWERFECVIPRKHSEPLRMDVHSSIIRCIRDSGICDLYVFAARDITNDFMSSIMERLFVHDLNNTAMKIQAFSFFLKETLGETFPDLAERSESLVDELIDSIASHRWISHSLRNQVDSEENVTLPVSFEVIDSLQLLEDIADSFNCGFSSHLLKVDSSSVSLEVKTVPGVLKRILNNLIKNSLEATDWSDEVVLGCLPVADGFKGNESLKNTSLFRFWVKGNSIIPEFSKSRIFTPDFSTKGRGRGFGSYSCKILGERFLGGKVWFESSESIGTFFYIDLPMNQKI